MHGGFKVLLLNRCGLNLCSRHSSKVSNSHGKNLATCHLIFAAKNRHRFALGDMDYDDHTERGEQIYIYIYIYIYIIHNASTQSRKVNAYIPRAWPKILVQESKQGLPCSKDEDEWYTA